MKRRNFLGTMMIGGGLLGCQVLLGRARGEPAEAATRAPGGGAAEIAARGPIIDVHMHAYSADAPISASAGNPVTGKPPGVADGEAHMRACLAEMKRLNVVKGIVSGGSGDRLAAAMQWHDAAPDRILAGAGVRGSADTPLPDLAVLRDAFAAGRLRVLGEVTAQYAGLTLSDPPYREYLALAEEFDIPVGVHMGMAPQRISYDPCCRNFRVGLGNPLLIEEALNRHPKLRVNLMHAAWPHLEDTIALMNVYPQVYVDLGGVRMGPAARRVLRLPWRPGARGLWREGDVRVRSHVLGRPHRHVRRHRRLGALPDTCRQAQHLPRQRGSLLQAAGKYLTAPASRFR